MGQLNQTQSKANPIFIYHNAKRGCSAINYSHVYLEIFAAVGSFWSRKKTCSNNSVRLFLSSTEEEEHPETRGYLV